MKFKKCIFAILIILWMIMIFYFSHQSSITSSSTSGNTIRTILNWIPKIAQMEVEKKEKIIEVLQPIVRKLAHFSIYTLGGILIMLYMNENSIKGEKKLLCSSLYGFFYAITDEIHQIFIPR